MKTLCFVTPIERNYVEIVILSIHLYAQCPCYEDCEVESYNCRNGSALCSTC